MKEEKSRRIHALLDGDATAAVRTPAEEALVAKYQGVLGRVGKLHAQAPAGLVADIMAALPTTRRRTLREWLEGILPERRQWGVPALAGAVAMLAAMLGVWHLSPPAHPPRVLVHFQIHAPGAQQVELVGDFNNWSPGEIRLQGPDASGHWTASVDLPEGHYEYQFLVNGKTWVTDPNAITHRPDGFGRENAVMDVYAEGS
jgi:hypothetical protein